MDRISLPSSHAPHVFAGTHVNSGPGQWLLARFRQLRAAVRREEYAFAAIGLAEGGDVEGAAELMERLDAK